MRIAASHNAGGNSARNWTAQPLDSLPHEGNRPASAEIRPSPQGSQPKNLGN
jgi:hypothetical protein